MTIDFKANIGAYFPYGTAKYLESCDRLSLPSA